MEQTRHTPGQPFAPIFVVGCVRSGTTLLAAILDRHSQLAVPPETWFCRGVLPRLIAARARGHRDYVDLFLANIHGAELELERGELLRRFAAYPCDPPHLLRAALECYASRRGKRRMGEKTPGHLYSAQLVLRWYPAARMVCVVRDGRDVALSLLKVPWSHSRLRAHCVAWNGAARRAIHLESAFPTRFMTIRFEDLVAAPEESVRRIDTFAGIEFEPGQLDPTIPTGVVPDRERPWKENALRAIDPARAGAWRQLASKEQQCEMHRVMSRMLDLFGYDVPSAPRTPVWRVGFDAVRNTGDRILFDFQEALRAPWIHAQGLRLRGALRSTEGRRVV